MKLPRYKWRKVSFGLVLTPDKHSVMYVISAKEQNFIILFFEYSEAVSIWSS